MANGLDAKILDRTTTNAYVYAVVEMRNWKSGALWIYNAGNSNQLKYTVDVRYHETNALALWEVEVAEVALGTETSAVHEITKTVSSVRVGVASNTTDQHTPCLAFFVKKRH